MAIYKQLSRASEQYDCTANAAAAAAELALALAIQCTRAGALKFDDQTPQLADNNLLLLLMVCVNNTFFTPSLSLSLSFKSSTLTTGSSVTAQKGVNRLKTTQTN